MNDEHRPRESSAAGFSGYPGRPRDDVAGESGSAESEATGTLLASTSLVAVATLLSRVTGFAKQAVLLAALGTAVASSYTLSTQIPNLVSELLVGAVLTAIVVPMMVRAGREDSDHGELFIRRIFTLTVTLLILAAALFTALTPFLVRRVFLPNDSEVSPALTTALTYLVVPAVVLYGISALLTSVLNTREVFAPGAWAPVLNNLTVLTVFAVYVAMPGELEPGSAVITDSKVLVLGLGTALGVAVQTFTLLPAVRAQRINLRPAWGVDKRLASFGWMAVAVVVYVLISQAGLIVSNRVAAGADSAGPAIYSSAWLLLQLPYGILGVTVLTVLMPRLSRHSADGDADAVIGDLSLATRSTLLGMIPAAVFFTAFGSMVVEVAFAYGRFESGSSVLGNAVSWSAFTLVPYALVLVHLRFFYAAQRPWTPTWIILGITIVKVGLSVAVPAVAASPEDVAPLLGAVNGASFTVGALIGWFLIRRSLGSVVLHRVRRDVMWLILASACGLGVSSAVRWAARATNPAPERWVVVVELALVFVAFVAVAIAVAFVGGVTEVRLLGEVLKRRLGHQKRHDRALDASGFTDRTANYDPVADDVALGPIAHPTAVIRNVRLATDGHHGFVIGNGRYQATTHVYGSDGLDYWDGFDRTNLRPITAITRHLGREQDARTKLLLDRVRKVDSYHLDGVDALIDLQQTHDRVAMVFQPRDVRGSGRHQYARTLVSVRALVRSALIADAAGSSLSLATIKQVRFDGAGIARVAFPASGTAELSSDLHILARAALNHLAEQSQRQTEPALQDLNELAIKLLAMEQISDREHVWRLASRP